MNLRKILLFYLAVSCLILGPALGRGFIFLLDMPWAPMIQLSDYTRYGLQPHAPLIVFLRILNSVVPGWALQKLLLLGILTGIGTAAYLTARTLVIALKIKVTPRQLTLVSLYAGFLALLNPFVYERLSAGQWLVLSGHAYTLFLAWLFLKYGATRRFWLAYVVFPIFSVHIWLIATVFTIISLAVIQIANRSFSVQSVKIIKDVGVFAVVNAFWIIPALIGNNELASAVSGGDFRIFKTANDPQVGALGNVINLYGLWRPISDMKDDYLLWFFYGLLLFGCTLLTIFILHKSSRTKLNSRIALFSGITLGLGILFSIGFGTEITAFILSWIQHIPGAAILRDTAKSIAVVSACISILSPIGIVLLAQKYKLQITKLIIVGVILTTAMMSGMLFGLGGSLDATDYPKGWYTVRSMTQNEDRILILPWQGYLDINFAHDQYMANPAENFFDAHIIQSRTTGNPGLDSHEDAVEETLNKAIDESGSLHVLQENIQPKLSHVVILKTGNWHRYDPIVSANNAYVAFEDSSVIVLRLPNN